MKERALAQAIELAIWWIVMLAVMRWLGRTRLRATSAPGTLRHPKSTLVIGAACSGFFMLIAGLSWLFPGKDGSLAITGLFAGFALLGVRSSWSSIEFVMNSCRTGFVVARS